LWQGNFLYPCFVHGEAMFAPSFQYGQGLILTDIAIGNVVGSNRFNLLLVNGRACILNSPNGKAFGGADAAELKELKSRKENKSEMENR